MQQKNVILFTITLICIRLTGLNGQAVKDADGNVYPAIENLKTTKYNDGTAIPLVKDEKAWKALKKSAYCWYNNNIANKDVYGALYNWYTVNTKKLCPKGWHVPTDADWTILTTFIGDPISAGDKLKESGQDHWKNTLNSGTNEFDFTAPAASPYLVTLMLSGGRPRNSIRQTQRTVVSISAPALFTAVMTISGMVFLFAA